MARTLDLLLIRTFVTVADCSSMTNAGNKLHLTQAAVSQHVRRLEDQLGWPLFERARAGLRLTRSGERLLRKARHLLALNDEILDDFGEQALKGPLRLGVPPDLIGTMIAPILKAFSETWPQVELFLVSSASPDLKEFLRKGELDLAILEEPAGQETGECLAVDRLVWVGARGGQAFSRCPLPISMVPATCAFRPILLDALHESGTPWRSAFETGSIEAAMTTVRADLAVMPWLSSIVPEDLVVLTDASLPDLCSFAITLHFAAQTMSPAATELACAMRMAGR
ncbi:transcriptional regulator [Gluconacetobacter sacchari DSM 12717]|uniref:LysR family transcriptional regulator n=2 Tax=Gluconacetobacter sacchari TaxID=92759 RepID=A0A7W4IG85_9PROT|nr:LysR family transcriptional regulator [Gluconacetobacter sacchari]MBB2162280.1 LysR family transcriptional regulator [Gluconacetobacter sacchari]GBQ22567.1 transcriptional regulator [Gluconacetobacter sacchari DSM 12717]